MAFQLEVDIMEDRDNRQALQVVFIGHASHSSACEWRGRRGRLILFSDLKQAVRS